MNVVKVLTGFVPLVAFSVLSPVVGAGWAAVAGLVVALVVVAATAQGGIKELPAAQAVILAAMVVLAFTGGPATDLVLVKYGPAVQGLLLGLFMLATAATTPFTEQYARSTTPPEVWHTRRFREVNQHISSAWGRAVLILGLCHLAAAELPLSGGHIVLRLAVNWVLPVIVLWKAMTYSRRTAEAAQAEARERHASATDGVPRTREAHGGAHEARQAHGAHEAGEVRA